MTEVQGAGAGDWELEPLIAFLTATTPENAEAAWVDALPAISDAFPPETWVCNQSVNTYGAGAHRNLYEVEGQRSFREWLQQDDVSIERFAEAVGPVQYASVQIHLQSLMPEGRSNRGWRVRVVGFPPLGIVACGLASHYQGTQNHLKMGQASARIRARALEILAGESKEALESWPAATAEHWEERGLMPDPVLQIGDLDISRYDEGRGAKLRMIRNTTVKKELATFFAIKGMGVAEFRDSGTGHLAELKDIALALGTVHA